MRIRVLAATGLHHHASGLRAWEPGDYEFSDDPAYRGWLNGQVERGAAQILSGDVPVPSSAPEGGAPAGAASPGNGSATASGTGEALKPGDRVEYTPKNGGAKSEHTLVALNDDGTLNLGGLLRKVDRDRVRRLDPEG